MKIIKDGKIIEDNWQVMSAEVVEQSLPAGDVIVPFTFWLEQQQALEQHQGKLAVYLNPDDEIELIEPYLHKTTLIAFNFPVLQDGRAYSQARILRDRFGYKGEVRAIGEVLRDQLFYMWRCGFNAFHIRQDKDIEDALNGLHVFSITYQSAADGAMPVYRTHRQQAQA